MHNSSFNIRTPGDFLHKMIVPQHEDFIQHNACARHALLTIILVYHMYEWVHGKKFSVCHFNDNYLSEHGMADMFVLARGITNGTKHFKPRASTSVQTGFSSAFSDGFVRPLNVEFPDGRQEGVDIFLREMVEFWKRQKQLGAF